MCCLSSQYSISFCQVVFGFNLENLILNRIWSKFASGQIVANTGVLHSRKFLIGGFSLLGTFFLFLLSIALSGQLLMNDHSKRPNAIFWDSCWICSAVKCELIFPSYVKAFLWRCGRVTDLCSESYSWQCSIDTKSFWDPSETVVWGISIFFLSLLHLFFSSFLIFEWFWIWFMFYFL